MRLRLTWGRFWELARFYQAAILNTVFGLSAYSFLVWLGLNIYAAQATAQVAGVIFNYVTYSRHVFRGYEPAKVRFIASYAVNYLMNLSILAILAQVVASPYVAGGATAIIASLINYFALKYFVFRADSL